ncbi:MAG: nucleoside-diphosphate kinase [Solirubrobacteraceae bacterium]|jgi:nucleoside-diphosphate kinase|nr:nucleoside-diphosphate kinase [Solirubrobacteraceae bacterium]
MSASAFVLPAASDAEKESTALQERTLVLVKPDAYARGLTGEIIARFERKGLFLVAARVLTMTPEIADDHYVEHIGAPFFDGLVKFITSGPLVALVLEGPSAITAARQLIGATNPLEAAPGSIRGDFATATSANLVHGSDGPDAASREIEIFFPGLA